MPPSTKVHGHSPLIETEAPRTSGNPIAARGTVLGLPLLARSPTSASGRRTEPTSLLAKPEPPLGAGFPRCRPPMPTSLPLRSRGHRTAGWPRGGPEVPARVRSAQRAPRRKPEPARSRTRGDSVARESARRTGIERRLERLAWLESRSSKPSVGPSPEPLHGQTPPIGGPRIVGGDGPLLRRARGGLLSTQDPSSRRTPRVTGSNRRVRSSEAGSRRAPRCLTESIHGRPGPLSPSPRRAGSVAFSLPLV